MSWNQIEPGMSIIRVGSIETKGYEWRVQVPPRSMIRDSIAPNMGFYKFEELKFTHGFLSQIGHHWNFDLNKSNQQINMSFFVHKSDLNFGITVQTCELQAFHGQLLKGKVNFDFKPVETRLRIPDPRVDPKYHWIASNITLAQNVWDDSVDMLKVILSFKYQEGGECIKNRPLKIKSSCHY